MDEHDLARAKVPKIAQQKRGCGERTRRGGRALKVQPRWHTDGELRGRHGHFGQATVVGERRNSVAHPQGVDTCAKRANGAGYLEPGYEGPTWDVSGVAAAGITSLKFTPA